MPTNEAALKDTLREVIGETVKTPPASNSSETNSASTQASTGETKSGETSGGKEYVSGIDISDIPEQDRPRFKEYISKKGKLLEDGYNKKFAELGKEKDAVAKAKAELDAVKSAPVNEQKAKAAKLLDQLIESSPAENRDALVQMRTIIEEETGIKQLSEDIKLIKQFVQSSVNSAVADRTQKVNAELDKLSELYGTEFVNKFREETVKNAVQFKDAPIKKLFLSVASALSDDGEFEQAILSQREKKSGQTNVEKLKAISSQGSGISGSVEDVDVKKTSMKDLIRSMAVKK